MQWFYSKDGQQVGPVEFSEIERLQAAGELNGDSLVWKQGAPNWIKLSEALNPTAPAAAPILAGETLPTTTSPRSDYGPIVSWGIIGALIPCAGLVVYIALVVLNIIEFFESRKAVEQGSLPATDYSRMHPALFILGLVCCGGLLYPLFMHYRNKSGYFKPQPHAVWVAIAVVVVSIGFTIVSVVMQVVAEAAAQGISG